MNLKEALVHELVYNISKEFDLNNDKLLTSITYKVVEKYEVNNVEENIIETDIEEKLNMFIQHKILEGLDKNSLKNLRYDLIKMKYYIDKPVCKITTNDLKMFLNNITDNSKSTTINNKISELKRFFGWLLEEGFISYNPSSKIKSVRVPKRLRNALSLEDIELLRIACKDYRENALFELLLNSGIRISECKNIKIHDINFNSNSIKVIGKGDKERIVFFNTRTKIYINKYLTTRKGESEYLFIGKKKPFKNLSSRSLEKILNNIQARSEVEHNIYPHMLRHSFATISLRRGSKITSVQALLGHASIKTTEIYAKESLENIEHDYKISMF